MIDRDRCSGPCGPRSRVELEHATVEYTDTAGPGAVVVLLHGLLSTAAMYGPVVADLRRDHRCVLPELPLGAHRIPTRPGADPTVGGLARLIEHFLAHLDLHDVVLVGDPRGLAPAVAAYHPACLDRLVLAGHEAFDAAGIAGHLVRRGRRRRAERWGRRSRRWPGHRCSRHRRRLPPGRNQHHRGTAMAKTTHGASLGPRGRGHPTTRSRADPDDQRRRRHIRRGIRRDLTGHLRSADQRARGRMRSAVAVGLAGFERPTLIVWGLEHEGRLRQQHQRLAGLLPQPELIHLGDPTTRTSDIASAIREFARPRPAHDRLRGSQDSGSV